MKMSDGTPGLTDAQVRERRRRFGPNDIESHDRHDIAATLRQVAMEPMFVLLLAAAAVYLVIGDLGEGLLLGLFAAVTVGLVIVQERRSERALDALRALSAPHVRVLREGRVQRIPARELVPGDVFLLAEGERVAADAVVRDAAGLAVDESLLTGESVPVGKLGEAPPVYASTLVVSGHGLAEVVAIGRETQVGRIGASLAGIEVERTPLQVQLRRIVRMFGAAAIAASLLLVAWYGWRRGDWVQGVLSGIAMGMSMLPEEFPMALAVFMALGAWRLAGVKVLARRPAVIEALGGATVLCVDKTGTLTENRMQLRRLVAADSQIDLARCAELPEPVHRLLEYAVLASRRTGVDPMDRAILAEGDRSLAGTEHLHPEWLLGQEYPLTADLLAMSQAWESADGTYRVAAKGAPEAIAQLCGLGEADTAALLHRVDALAQDGLRVLAVAQGTHPDGELPLDHREFDFALLGLVAFEDPLRASVPEAVAQARTAGIAVAMITGDRAATALAIARQAGLDTGAGTLTGVEIDTLDDTALSQAVRRVRVFARVTPDQKLRLVEAFKRNGEVVAMTGDGVNDAPALKAAHIGIAMGVRGTDVAREAAGLVLLEEDFGRIVAGVRMGRRIFDNLRKVMTYITAIHVPIVGLALLPVLAGLPPVMLPVHVVLTELVVDPVCSLAFENAPEEAGVMRRPPRKAGAALLGWSLLVRGFAQGAAVLAVALALYAAGLGAGATAEDARTLAIVVLTFGNLLLVAVNASAGIGWSAVFGRGFGAFRVVAALALGALAAGIALPPARALLHFGDLASVAGWLHP